MANKITLFLDCDDTLYSNDWTIAGRLTAKIGEYTAKMQLPDGVSSFDLYKRHGTCLRGLEKENIPHDREDFLKQCHDIELDDVIKPDPELRAMLQRIDLTKCSPWIYTASVDFHAQRCIECLKIDDALPNKQIIDVKAVGYLTKYEEGAYRAAERIAGATAPQNCILVDDSWSNMAHAKAAGWQTILCGRTARDGRDARFCEHADHVIESIHQLPTVLGDLFLPAASGDTLRT